MALWTKRHTIPVVFDVNLVAGIRGSYAFSIIFEAKIWTVCEVQNNDGSFQTRLFVFDPVSEVFNEINCIYPAVWPQEFQTFIIDGSDLYIWREPDEWSGRDHYLYKLNRVTLEWEFIMKAVTESGDSLWKSMVVIDQIMYILENDSDSGEISLITIDIPKKKTYKKASIANLWNGFVSKNKNHLYLIEIHSGSRKVSEVKNDVLIEIVQEELSDNVGPWMKHVHCSNSYEFGARTFGDQTFDVQMFDFETLKWESKVIDSIKITNWLGRPPNFGLQSTLKVDGSIYILKPKNIAGGWHNGLQFEFHVLDLHPPLQSICLEDLAARLSEEKDELKVEDMKRSLSIQMRGKLDELIKWRREAEPWF